MIRLTIRSQTPEEVVLEVAGWVSGEDVDILAQEGERLLALSRCLVLDLGGVQFMDEAGISLLRRWSGDRLVLRGGLWFVRALLEKYGVV